jgi:DNA-binding transcriptional ArsR family regulator
MNELDVLKKRKESYWVYYSLNKEVFEKYNFIEALMKDIRKEKIFQNDLKKLKKYLESPKSCHL